jgi:hypothetical protein
MEADRDLERGRRLLKELLPWARSEAKKDSLKFEPKSALGRASMSHVSEDKLDAVMIYPAPKGGWHGDVVLKGVPPGVPDAFWHAGRGALQNARRSRGRRETCARRIAGHRSAKL